MVQKIIHPSHFPSCHWLTEVSSWLRLAPDASPSHPIGPPRVVAWLHQKLVYLSRALDVYCSTFFRVHPHTHTRWQNTPTPYPWTSHNAPRRHSGSAARPAGDDSDTSECSTGITFRQPDDPILTETTSERLRVQPGAGWSAGFCSHRRRVKRLTSQKKNNKKKIVPSLVKSQADFSTGLKKTEHTQDLTDLPAILLTTLGKKRDAPPRDWEKTLGNTCRLEPVAWNSQKQTEGEQITATEKTQLRKWEWPVTFCCRGKYQRYVTPLLWLEWWWGDGWVDGWRDRFKLKRRKWSDGNWMSERGTAGGGQDTKWAKYMD